MSFVLGGLGEVEILRLRRSVRKKNLQSVVVKNKFISAIVRLNNVIVHVKFTASFQR